MPEDPLGYLMLLYLALFLRRYPPNATCRQNRHINVSAYVSRSIELSRQLTQGLNFLFGTITVDFLMPSFCPWSLGSQIFLQNGGPAAAHWKAVWSERPYVGFHDRAF